jgi:ubiquinone/menaquinone biosynthesis C-methylase UbiE
MLGGASYAMSVDILKERFIGLETADIFIQHDALCFDRVLGDMNSLPLREGVFDIIFLTSTLHHSSDLSRTLQQIARVMAPNGTAIIMNEPVRSILWPRDIASCDEIEHGINEHVYSIFEYLSAIRHAGLRPKLLFPRSIARKLDNDDLLAMQEMGSRGYQIITRLWQHKLGNWSVNTWLLPIAYIVASMPMVLHAKKKW